MLEPKPGVEPTASHLQVVLVARKTTPAKMTLYYAYQDAKLSERSQNNAGVPAVKMPITVTRLVAAGTKR